MKKSHSSNNPLVKSLSGTGAMLGLLSLTLFQGCENMRPASMTDFAPEHVAYQFVGRIDHGPVAGPILTSAGAMIRIGFAGDSIIVKLKDLPYWDNHNYMSYYLDGSYVDRFVLSPGKEQYTLHAHGDQDSHVLELIKATEAQIGSVQFLGVQARSLTSPPPLPERRIEFIGNSITCGQGNDEGLGPCGEGAWYDQHNAALAYGPLLARDLDAQWLLSSVSGIGIYRTWNRETPSMPLVYDQLYLTPDSGRGFDHAGYKPDLISICLGTNDFSLGDGSPGRPAVDSATFVSDYITFANKLHLELPETPIILLSSPLQSGETDSTLNSWLLVISEELQTADPKTWVYQYDFQGFYNQGCSGHPSGSEHVEMVNELLPVFRQITGW